MKRIKYFILIFMLSANMLSFSEALPKDQALRWLKLGNTYREGANYAKAAEYIKKGEALLNTSEYNKPYWQAVALEYKGYLHKDIGHISDAKSFFRDAIRIYKRVLKQKDGSQFALEHVIVRLENIDFSSNPASTKIANRSHIKVFNFDNCKLKDLPYQLPSKTSNLSMENNKLKEIPSSVFQLKHLEYLNVSKNKIKSLSAGITSLSNLHSLNLSNNKIKTIPDDIGKLNQLTELDLSNNKLKAIPIAIESLKNLQILNLTGNKIPFGQLKNLLIALPKTNILHDEYTYKSKAK